MRIEWEKCSRVLIPNLSIESQWLFRLLKEKN